MKCFVKTLLAVLAAVTCAVSVQMVQADEYLIVEGKIVDVDRELSIVVILPYDGVAGADEITIIGFPFHNLEMQLDEVLDPLDPDAQGITIDVGDCLTVAYFEKNLLSGGVVNKWEALLAYHEECTGCIPGEPCFDDEKEALEREPQHKNRTPTKR